MKRVTATHMALSQSSAMSLMVSANVVKDVAAVTAVNVWTTIGEIRVLNAYLATVIPKAPLHSSAIVEPASVSVRRE